ncbi:MAG: hypothetical protein ACM3ZC_06460 [Bacteroidota bacterium]
MSAKGEHGQSTLEYILLILLIGVVACAALAVANGGLSELMEKARVTVSSWFGR